MDVNFSLDNINIVAKEFWQQIKEEKVIAFHGQMGAGKTTFIHALCEARGVKDVVSSPTFSIINEYEYDCEGTKKVIFHMDLYRIKDEKEAIDAGVEDCLYSGYISFVEWPEKVPAIFPEQALHIFIDIIDDKTRRLRIRQK